MQRTYRTYYAVNQNLKPYFQVSSLSWKATGPGWGGYRVAVQPREGLDCSHPRNQGHLLIWVRIRRKLAAGKEMLRPSNWVITGQQRRLVGRTHAYHGSQASGRERGQAEVHRGCVSVGLWQDQPCYAQACPGRVRHHLRRRRYCLAEIRQWRLPEGHQSRFRFLAD